MCICEGLFEEQQLIVKREYLKISSYQDDHGIYGIYTYIVKRMCWLLKNWLTVPLDTCIDYKCENWFRLRQIVSSGPFY